MALRLGILEDGATGELELLRGVGGELANGVLHEVIVGVVLVAPGQRAVDLKREEESVTKTVSPLPAQLQNHFIDIKCQYLSIEYG